MRSFLLLAVFAALLGIAVVAPYAGLLSWAWFSFMHPQRETYGFTTYFSFDFYAAIFTMLVWVVSRERKVVPLGATTILLFLFAAWICVTTYFAIDPDFSFTLWDRTEKSLLLALFVIIMTTTLVRAHALVWIIAISLGYYAATGVGWILGGGGHVTGPQDSMIADNNALGVALVSIIPLLVYLGRTSANKFVAMGSLSTALITVLTVIGTYSRGAFLGLALMGVLMVVRSRAKLWGLGIGAIAVAIALATVPANWYQRMGTISETPDESVQGRYNAWHTAWNAATRRPLTGGGFSFGEQQAVWDEYSDLPKGSHLHAAHNIYFEVLGEHGFIGLTIYVLLMLSALRNTVLTVRKGKNWPEAKVAVELANALQLSIICVAVAGNSLSLAYYDVYLTLYALTFALRRIVEQAAADVLPAAQSRSWSSAVVSAQARL